MLHSKFRGNSPPVLEKKILRDFYHILAWWTSGSCDQHHVHGFSFPCTRKLTYNIWLKMAE